MGRDTGIQWCDDTVNPTSGCDGCELFVKPPTDLAGDELKEWLRKQPCYASHVHQNRLAHSFPEKYARSFGDVRTIPGRLQKCTNWPDLTGKDRPDKPWLNGMPRLIFISDMADALSEAVSFDYLLAEVINPVIAWQKNRHVGMWLTKRPERMAKFAAWLKAQGILWPRNLWAGTSVTNQRTAELRIPELLRVPALYRFLSIEPLRTAADLTVDGLVCTDCSCVENARPDPDTGGIEFCRRCDRTGKSDEWGIEMVICGGESGSKARSFDLAWARSLRDQCKAAGVAFFMKQLGAKPYQSPQHEGATGYEITLKDGHGGDWLEWPEDLRVREFPHASN